MPEMAHPGWPTRPRLRHLAWRARTLLSQTLHRALPEHRAFRFRAALLRLGGMAIAPDARICGSVNVVYGNLRVGRDTYVGPRVSIYTNGHAGVVLGDYVDVAPEVVLHAGTHLQDRRDRRAGTGRGEDIIVGDGTWIGVRAVLLYGTRIGRRCIVTPGAVVRGVFPDNCLIGGVPARVIRELGE